MTVRVFYSTDASAPALTTAAGSLITVLDACLVNGYGSRTAAGWTKPFTGSSLAAYRAGVGGLQRYLAIDDTAVSNTKATGYLTMTAVATGTGAFPDTSQLAGGTFITKIAGAWRIIATESTFYLCITPAGAATGGVYSFGDFVSRKTSPVDNMATMLCAGTAAAQSTNFTLLNAINTVTLGHYTPGNYTEAGGSQLCGKHADLTKTGATLGLGTVVYPNGPDGSILYSPIMVHDVISAAGHVRGTLPGVWAIQHSAANFTDRFTTTGTGTHSTKTFEVWKWNNNASVMLVETSNTW